MVPDPWPDDELDRVDAHLEDLAQLRLEIQEKMMSNDDDRIAEERMREANQELLRKLTEEVERNGGHAGK